MRIVAFTGGVIAFAAAALFYLTAGAAVGDAVYVWDDAAPPAVLTNPQRSALGAAVISTGSAFGRAIVGANVDEVSCWQSVECVTEAAGVCSSWGFVFRCLAWESVTVTDDQFFALVATGKTPDYSATATANVRKKLGPVVVSQAGPLADWETFTQAAFGSPREAVWAFTARRTNPGDLTEVTVTRDLIKTASKTQFRSDYVAGLVRRLIGEVAP